MFIDSISSSNFLIKNSSNITVGGFLAPTVFNSELEPTAATLSEYPEHESSHVC
jgi:hypothetical protein